MALKFIFLILRTLKTTLFYIFQIIKSWWFFILPILLIKPALNLWLWYVRAKWVRKIKYILLEIKLPKEVVKPMKAMEEVFAGIHSIHDVFDFREVWLEGKFQLALSFEIVSDGGKIHFYIRCPEIFRDIVESNIYAQFPDAEIYQVEDYTKLVPQNIPNENWDLFGFDEITTKPNPYPIKTYKYFEERTDIPEEKRVSPLAGLLEGMATLKEGEYLWYQIWAKPIREEIPWRKEGLKIVNELVNRPKEKPPKSILSAVIDLLVRGKPPEEKPSEEKGLEALAFPEMRLTPGEKEIVKGIEDKISKFGYECLVRYLYLGKRDVFFKPKARIPFGFFKEISTENMNGLKPNTKTMPKVHHPLLEKRRVYLRKRKLFKRYCQRLPTLFPFVGGTYVLNTEELATLYHFPGKVVAPAPTIERVEARKKEPPPTLIK